MKFRLTKNLAPLRANALARLDEAIGATMAELLSSPVARIRDRKVAEAEIVAFYDFPVAPLLSKEAEDKGIPLKELAATVLERAAAATALIVAAEADRQRRQALIRDATNPHEVTAALDGLGSAS